MPATRRRKANARKAPAGVRFPRFKMPFQAQTIDHLGFKLYSTLPPVISELVSNAWDAEAPKVEVEIPLPPEGSGAPVASPPPEIVVRDFGHGMTPRELNEEFLPVGRERRGPEGTRDRPTSRQVV